MTIALAAFGIMVVLMIFNVPIALCTAFAALGAILMSPGVPVMTFVQRMYVGMDSFTFLAIPLFILAGRFMAIGGITKDLINVANVLVGFLRGGLAYINIVASMLFAGITGSAAADTASVGGIMIPTMIEKGFDKDFSVAVTACSSTIGVMIPPSITMVVYGVASGASIGKMFLGGIIPGILIGVVQMLVSWRFAVKHNYPAEKRYPPKEAFIILLKGIPSVITIIIIVGGITAGVFTPTEAAGIAALYTLLLGMFYYKELKLKDIPKIILETASSTGVVILMIATASALGWVFAQQGVPAKLAAFVLGLTTNKYLLLLAINVLLLFVGTWMDSSPAITIFTPILLPIVTALGIDPVHFGVIMVVNLAIGLCTPPVGVCLFLSCGIAKISITDVMRAFLPFLIAMIVVLLMITYIPGLVMFLPNLLMG